MMMKLRVVEIALFPHDEKLTCAAPPFSQYCEPLPDGGVLLAWDPKRGVCNFGRTEHPQPGVSKDGPNHLPG